MDKAAYLVFNLMVASSLVGALWLPTFWRRWRGLLAGLLLVSLPYIVWDVIATAAGHWSFNNSYTLGWRLAGLPIEELLFFITVPVACMVVWELINKTVDPQAAALRRHALRGLVLLITLASAGLVLAHGLAYTQLALASVVVSSLALIRHVDLVIQRRWWWFQAASFALFFIGNSILTGLPIVTYGASHILGWRIGTIPVEDFAYNFSLLNLFLLAYENFTYRQRRQA